MIRVVTLLGNPGPQYRRTRHNAAWLFAEHNGWMELSWRSKRGAETADVTIAGYRLVLHRALRFMNRSGESLGQLLRFHRYGPEELLVIHDDVELPFGEVVGKSGGGLAGHNGLRSIADRVGSRSFARLRIGVGRPAHGQVSDHVLSAFTEAERASLPSVFSRARQLLEDTIGSR